MIHSLNPSTGGVPLNEFLWHSKQGTSPEGLYVPYPQTGTHSPSDLLPLSLVNVPSGQGLHDPILGSSWYIPFGHSVHWFAPFAPKNPAGHSRHRGTFLAVMLFNTEPSSQTNPLLTSDSNALNGGHASPTLGISSRLAMMSLVLLISRSKIRSWV